MLKAYQYRIYPNNERKVQKVQIKSATISQVPSEKYFVSILVETDYEEIPHTNRNIGLDLGIRDLCIP